MKRIRAALAPGQSNEGASGQQPDAVHEFGCPYADPITGGRSMWPRLIERLGREQNIWLSLQNTAVGSTSVVESWAGGMRDWSNGMIVLRGSWIISSGGIWKCNAAAGVAAASTTQPTGTSNTTGADGVPWLYSGAPQAGDVTGAVFAEGSARFDPNGYIAAAYAAVNPATYPGFDEYWIFGSIGQGDKTVSTVRARFDAGFQSVYDYMLSREVNVAAGFTCRAATSGADAWYNAQLVPGYQDTLAHYASNENVIAGANLYSTLGILPVSPTLGLPGLQADETHMNDIAYRQASDAWHAALTADERWARAN